jgi:hypothetical protein
VDALAFRARHFAFRWPLSQLSFRPEIPEELGALAIFAARLIGLARRLIFL